MCLDILSYPVVNEGTLSFVAAHANFEEVILPLHVGLMPLIFFVSSFIGIGR